MTVHCGGSPSSAHLIYVHTYLIVYWFIGWFISLRCKSPQQKMRPSSYFKTVFQWVTLVSEEANCDLAFPSPLKMNNSFAINIQSVEAFLVYYLWEVVLFSGSRQKWKHKEKKKKKRKPETETKQKTKIPSSSSSLSRSTLPTACKGRHDYRERSFRAQDKLKEKSQIDSEKRNTKRENESRTQKKRSEK